MSIGRETSGTMMASARTMALLTALVSVTALTGCDEPKTDGAGGGYCPDLMANECTPMETEQGCISSLCGPLEVFDDNGCPRRSCNSNADCAADEVCYDALQHGGCNSSMVICVAESEGCECSGNNDCGGKYCVAASDVP